MSALQGAGLGLRREILTALQQESDSASRPDFIEFAPENWLGFGGRHAKQLQRLTADYPSVCHGLSLSIGGLQPIDIEFVKKIRDFLDQHHILVYSEHLSYTHDGGYLYDLLPIPMTPAAVTYVADRVQQVQEILGRRLVLENVSTYAMPSAEMTEAEFVAAVVQQADCELLLDVNNVYVNSINHGSNPQDFIRAMPADRVRYLHVAGHYVESDALLIDTHGTAVADPVWELLDFTYRTIGVRPTLLERDFNIPTFETLLAELTHIRSAQQVGAVGRPMQELQYVG
ncbi:MAG: DUF692 domain-containing protein [Pseudomonadota bacterium]|nr:DUF692 domain-containing protein [Pseudomonadota bacterium]